MHRVVILGAGYAGLEACKKMVQGLGRELERGEVEITLVSTEPYHTFHGWTGEVLGGLLPLEHTLTPLDLLPFLKRVRFVEGRVTALNLGAQQVTVQSKLGPEILGYEHVFLGLGSRDPFERIPGLERFGWGLKNTRHMQNFRAELHNRIAQALEGKRPLERVAVVGGGFAGVECAAALAELFQDAYKNHSRASRPQITLLQSGTHLLETLRPRFSRIANYATAQLEGYGVEIRYGTRISEITARGVQLEDGQALEATMVLVTAGISLLDLPGSETLSRDPRRRIKTNPFLQVEGQSRVWSGGDSAKVSHPWRSSEDCPVNALWAMKQGLHAGLNIARVVKGHKPRPFRYPGLGQAASLGWGRGISEIYGMQFTGMLGWLLRIGFFVWYMPSKKRGFQVLSDLLTLKKRGRKLEPMLLELFAVRAEDRLERTAP